MARGAGGPLLLPLRLLLLGRWGASAETDEAVREAVPAWEEDTLKGTHFWDCNGAGCDATTLKPWNSKRFVFASQYAPMDPKEFEGGSRYGEKLWLIGAASDDLAERMGPDVECCGHDKRSQACGKCLLVRNPTAVHAEWTAVVMKKSRCPPESQGCEIGKLHMDLAVPGLDVLAESTANVCGENRKADTFITRAQSSVCGDWLKHGNSTITGCNCSLLPDSTQEQRLLRRGCERFVAWGWTSGDPNLQWKQVPCPSELEDRVKGSFGFQGVHPPSETPWVWYGIITVCVLCCIVVGVVNYIIDRRDQKKKHKRRQGMRNLNSNSSYSSSESSASLHHEDSTLGSAE